MISTLKMATLTYISYIYIPTAPRFKNSTTRLKITLKEFRTLKLSSAVLDTPQLLVVGQLIAIETTELEFEVC
jgi:hypothetical protein